VLTMVNMLLLHGVCCHLYGTLKFIYHGAWCLASLRAHFRWPRERYEHPKYCWWLSIM